MSAQQQTSVLQNTQIDAKLATSDEFQEAVKMIRLEYENKLKLGIEELDQLKGSLQAEKDKCNCLIRNNWKMQRRCNRGRINSETLVRMKRIRSSLLQPKSSGSLK